MKSSPHALHRIGDLIPIVTCTVHRRFQGVPDDLVKDAVSSAIEKYLTIFPLDHTSGVGEMFSWLRTTATNEILHELRRSSKYAGSETTQYVLEHLVDGNQPDVQASRRILWEWLISQLGAKIAETIWLHEIECCPPRDIAVIQNIKVSSVKARITRARRILRQYQRWLC